MKTASMVITTVAVLSMFVISISVFAEDDEFPVILAMGQTQETPGGDRPDYTDGCLVLSQTYDMILNYTASTMVNNAIIVIEISGTLINASDVIVEWYDTSRGWTRILWQTYDGSLFGQVGTPTALSPGEWIEYYVTISYMAIGEFSLKAWVEGETQ